jgi:hypothetical protein
MVPVNVPVKLPVNPYNIFQSTGSSSQSIIKNTTLNSFVVVHVQVSGVFIPAKGVLFGLKLEVVVAIIVQPLFSSKLTKSIV